MIRHKAVKLSPVSRRIRKYWLASKTNLQNNLAYTANFIFETLFYVFYVFILSQLWLAVFSQRKMMAGYTLKQLIWYCIIAEMISFSGSNIFQELNTEIKGGNIAYTFNKPYHYVWYQLANEFGTAIFKLLLKAIIGIVFGMIVTGPLDGFSLGFLLPLLFVILNGLLLNFFLLTCLGLTSFWLEENTAFFWIHQKLLFMLGLFLPLEFFPQWLQKVILVLPFPYITYGPAKLLVDFSWLRFYEIAGMQVLLITGFGMTAFAIYRRGVKLINVNGG